MSDEKREDLRAQVLRRLGAGENLNDIREDARNRVKAAEAEARAAAEGILEVCDEIQGSRKPRGSGASKRELPPVGGPW